jgi:archaemetzincin
MDARPRIIYLVPLGQYDMVDLGIIAESVEEHFDVPTKIADNQGPPAYALNPDRQQYNSNLILLRLQGMALPDALKVLGITSYDLFSPIFSYVFGEAQFGGRCAVISTYRLRGDPTARLRPGCPPLISRVEKEAIHELGHTFGLRHCSDRDCVMHFSPGIECADRKFGSFCRACLDLVYWFMETRTSEDTV